MNNGLLSGTAECGLFDSRGFVWIGTREGLHRFDGKNVVHYLPDITDPGSIKSRAIFGIAEDKLGQIWLSGERGIEVYLPGENCFEFVSDGPQAGTGRKPIFWLMDSLDIGVVNSFTSLPHRSPVISLTEHRFITAREKLTQAQKEEIEKCWLYRSVLSPFYSAREQQEFNYISYFPKNDIEIIRETGDKDGLWVYTKRRGGFYKFTHGAYEPEWRPVNHAWPEIEEHGLMSMMNYDDTLAIAGLQGFGLLLFHKNTGEVLRSWDLREDPALDRKSDFIFLMKDPSGRVWFSIMPYGVFVFHPLSPRFQVLKTGIKESLLHNGLIRSLHCDTTGRLWIGYHDGYVQAFDPLLKKLIYQFVLPPDRNNILPAVESIDFFPDGSTSFNNSLSIKQTGNKIDFVEVLDSIHFSNFNNDHIPELTGHACGKHMDFYILGHGTPVKKIMPPSHRLFLKTTYVGGSKFFYGAGGIFGILSFNTSDSCTIIDRKNVAGSVSGVYIDQAHDSLWMATETGLWLYDLEDLSVRKIDSEHWPSQYLYGIVPDDVGNLWISSNAGLIRYNPATNSTRFMGLPEGMQSNEFNTNCYAKMKDGSLAFAGPEGLNVFHPSYFDETAEPFYVYMAGVSIKEKQMDHFNSLSPSFEWVLDPDEKSIEIKYAATKYVQRTGLKYYVQLEGADPFWVDRGGLESVRYINLKPDKYTLRIKAKDGQGNWSRNEVNGTIIVRPTFFQTTWFIILCGLITAGILYALYQYRIRQLKHVLIIRNRISRDLHDDIGSTLGSISVYSEVAKTTSVENRIDVLDKIGDASREMLEKLNDIVWSINPENDTLERMEKRMRSYAAMMLNPLNIEFDLQLKTNDQSTRLNMDHRRNLFLIFKEALHNAAKYSKCRHIGIVLEETHGQIRMEINDDGIGFDPEQKNGYNGNGIDSMKQRAKSISADLKIESRPGHGTKIHLRQK